MIVSHSRYLFGRDAMVTNSHWYTVTVSAGHDEWFHKWEILVSLFLTVYNRRYGWNVRFTFGLSNYSKVNTLYASQ